ncbi:MAG: YIP1 family protein [Candidatus Baltobacteraceae bacterium]|jgi:hypothetical protein
MFAGTNAGIPARSLLERARNIILGPGTEWLVAAAEQTSPAALFSGYVVPLALIGPVCMVLGQLFFGHHPLPIVLPLALVSFALELAAVFVAASIANALAPSFGGQKNLPQALKLIAYSSTPRWLGGVLTIVPLLGPLAVAAGLYGLYLLYLGVPSMTRVAPDRAAVFTLVTVLALVLVWALVGFMVGFAIATLIAGATLASRAILH